MKEKPKDTLIETIVESPKLGEHIYGVFESILSSMLLYMRERLFK